MPLTKTPTSSLSGSSILYCLVLPLNVSHSDRVARHASLVPQPSWNPENVFWSRFSKRSCATFVPCRQASSRDCSNDHRPSHIQQAQSPRVLPGLLLLVHRRRSLSPPYPYSYDPLAGKEKTHVALSSYIHVQAWFASLGQEVPDLRRLSRRSLSPFTTTV